MKHTISTTYALKWQLRDAPNYKFTADGVCINGRTGRIIRKVVNGRCGKIDDILNKNRDKPWFVDEKGSMSQYYAEYTLKLKMDNDKDIQMRGFWCGYFEGLYEAEIVAEETDMKISFR